MHWGPKLALLSLVGGKSKLPDASSFVSQWNIGFNIQFLVIIGVFLIKKKQLYSVQKSYFLIYYSKLLDLIKKESILPSAKFDNVLYDTFTVPEE